MIVVNEQLCCQENGFGDARCMLFLLYHPANHAVRAPRQ